MEDRVSIVIGFTNRLFFFGIEVVGLLTLTKSPQSSPWSHDRLQKLWVVPRAKRQLLVTRVNDIWSGRFPQVFAFDKIWLIATSFILPLPTARHSLFPILAKICRFHNFLESKFDWVRINLLEPKRTATTALGWSTSLRGERRRVGWPTKPGDTAKAHSTASTWSCRLDPQLTGDGHESTPVPSRMVIARRPHSRKRCPH